jgi:dihydrofolate reductase
MAELQADLTTSTRAAATAADLELVVAVSQNDVIGRANALPWHLPADLKHFRALTLGKAVLMGRRTYQSIGRALPGRTNIVMTRADFNPTDCVAVTSLEAARQAAGAAVLMVIGGAEVYRLALPFVRRIHLTLVHTLIADGDAFFRDWHDSEWRIAAREPHAADEKNAFAYEYLTLERDCVVTAAPAAR